MSSPATQVYIRIAAARPLEAESLPRHRWRERLFPTTAGFLGKNSPGAIQLHEKKRGPIAKKKPLPKSPPPKPARPGGGPAAKCCAFTFLPINSAKRLSSPIAAIICQQPAALFCKCELSFSGIEERKSPGCGCLGLLFQSTAFRSTALVELVCWVFLTPLLLRE